MALRSSLGLLDSTLGNIQPGLGAPALTRSRRTFLQVTVNGTQLTNVLSARVSLGFDMAVSEATVVLAAEPGFGTSYDDTVRISMGAGANNVRRFTGLLKQYDRNLYPRTVTLIARGRLSKAQDYKPVFEADVATAMWVSSQQASGIPGLLLGVNQDPSGGTVPTLMGTMEATDENVVFAALQAAGLNPNAGNIGGTGTDLGGLPPDASCWGFGETALAFIQKIDQASLGYRTFESIGGTIYRVQIAGWPGNQGQDFTFTEGLDIFTGRSTRTELELRNVARVEGYNGGIGAAGAFILDESSGTPREIRMSTTLAGRINASDTGPGFSCEDIASYLLREWNRELVRLTLTTPRDDVIGPGQTHLVTTASGQPDRLGTAEPLWVQHVEIAVDEAGAFSQTITYLGGGTADGYSSPVDWSSA